MVKDIVKDGGKKDRNVAGRKKYPIDEEKVEKPEEKEVDESDEAVTAEMNSILKMSPGSSLPPKPLPTKKSPLTNQTHSNHLLQILLRLLPQSQINPPNKILHNTHPLRRRARQAPSRPRAAGPSSDHDGPKDGAECAG